MNSGGYGDGEEEDPSKMFIGGLSWDTEDADLKSHFSQFGEVTDVHVMFDKATMKSRCFGFVTFKDSSSVELVLKAPSHVLKSKTVDAKKCNKKAAAQARIKRSGGGPGEKTKKVFVGGLPATADEEALKKFFGEFGEVVDSVIVIDPETKRPRGFGFVTFESEDSVERVVQLHFHNMQGKQVECKAAQPRMPGMGRSAPGGGHQNQQGGWGMQGPGGYQQEGSWGGNTSYGSAYHNMDPYASQNYSGGYGQQPQSYGSGYDYSNMGGSYAQQQSSYGPERSAYAGQTAYNTQAPAYGGQGQSTYGYGGYSADPASAYGSSYGSSDPSYASQQSSGSSRGYHPYGR